MIRRQAVTLSFVMLSFLASGQTPRPQMPVRVVSPEVHADRTVTFRLRALNAKTVALQGELTPKPLPLSKSDPETGLWTVTTGALQPDTYSYSFRVDDVTVPDPSNPEIKAGESSFANVVSIPGETPHPWDVQDVPHGIVHRHSYRSTAASDTRQVVVYTPPGYDAASGTKYPVLYLLHGSGDLSTSWVDHGKANWILDNLIAQKKAKPMLVVMPYGRLFRTTERSREAAETNLKRFESDLLESVIPLVEKGYKVNASKASRALAGLSMGGGQTLYAGLRHPELFDSLLAFSPSVTGADAFAAASLKAPRLFWVGIGKDDFLIAENEKFNKFLTESEVKHTYKVTEGAHNWLVWRRYLSETVPMLFQ
ncbi:MAG: esterase [Bryobacteraceae bacterium]|nr:esterase [Bryobacteraceae bacterium]